MYPTVPTPDTLVANGITVCQLLQCSMETAVSLGICIFL